VPRAKWRFASAGTITLDGGFSAGRIYDVVYRARDPRVVGVGLSGTRDLVSFFKYATAAEGNPMPGVQLAIGWASPTSELGLAESVAIAQERMYAELRRSARRATEVEVDEAAAASGLEGSPAPA
jgi:hypothetical protein